MIAFCVCEGIHAILYYEESLGRIVDRTSKCGQK